MNKKQKYFLKQKLIGVGIVLFCIISSIMMGDATGQCLILPMGIFLIFTKEKAWVDDDYFCENDEDEES